MDLSETTIVDATLYTLGFFSLLTWSVILLKTGEIIINKLRNHTFMQAYRKDPTKSGATDLTQNCRAPLARVHQAGLKTLSDPKVQLAIRLDRRRQGTYLDLLERTMRQQIQQEKAHMDTGLGWLASIGSTAPFVGLFGTVWGIMYALQDISAKGSASLEVVAGPIGQALIATAVGIAVAVPAVIAYNFLLRQNRGCIAALDRFAGDFLHATIQNHLIDEQTVNEHDHAHTQ